MSSPLFFPFRAILPTANPSDFGELMFKMIADSPLQNPTPLPPINDHTCMTLPAASTEELLDALARARGR
ncbi:unnamed protein product [Cuscuta europaea]|uniref:Uncharacterized protein n=1 Tax=Cuscuta europaea TaxID=41803 RepID=A0A9P0ZI69_CUSEU|nr:unnamed protein product [Cuscuta europaea]